VGYRTEVRAIAYFRQHARAQGWHVSEHESFSRRVTPLLAPRYHLRAVDVPNGIGNPDITLRRDGAPILVADIVDKAFHAYDFEPHPVDLHDESAYIDHPGPLAPFQRAVTSKALQAPADDIPFLVVIGTSPRRGHPQVPELNIHDLAIGLEGGDLSTDQSTWLAPHSPVSAAALLSIRDGEQVLEVLINPRAEVPLDPTILQSANNVVELGTDFRTLDHDRTRRWARADARDLGR